jgi:hypothetical protein
VVEIDERTRDLEHRYVTLRVHEAAEMRQMLLRLSLAGAHASAHLPVGNGAVLHRPGSTRDERTDAYSRGPHTQRRGVDARTRWGASLARFEAAGLTGTAASNNHGETLPQKHEDLANHDVGCLDRSQVIGRWEPHGLGGLGERKEKPGLRPRSSALSRPVSRRAAIACSVGTRYAIGCSAVSGRPLHDFRSRATRQPLRRLRSPER